MARCRTLNRDKVLDAALDLVNAEGLAALSMRRLASIVGVEAMSLYNHIANKRDLLDGMAGRVFESIVLPDPGLPWSLRLAEAAANARERFAEHPVVVAALAAGQANPRSAGALRFIDALLGALLDAGLDERAAVRHYRALLGLLFGDVLVVANGPGDHPGEPVDPIVDWFRRSVSAQEHPHLHRVLPALIDENCKPDFAQAVEMYVAGVRVAVGRATGSAASVATRPDAGPSAVPGR